MKGFADLADVPEDDRIAAIGRYVEAHAGQVVGFAVDTEPGDRKAKRYVDKLTKRFKVRVLDTTREAPVAGATLVRVVHRGDA